MTFEWLAFQQPSLNLPPSLLGYGVLVLFAVAAGFLFYQSLHDFKGMSLRGQSFFLIALILGAVLARVFVISLSPFTSFAALALLPMTMVAYWQGRAPALVVGGVTGLTTTLFGGEPFTLMFSYALLGYAIAVMLQQRFDGTLGTAMRQPLASVPLASTVVGWPLAVVGILVSSGGEVVSAFERAALQMPPLLVASLVMGIAAGGLVQGALAVRPGLRREVERVTPPWRRHLSQRALWSSIPLGVLAIFILVSTVAIASYSLATRVVVDQMERDAVNAGNGIPFFIQVGRGLIRDLADDRAQTDSSIGLVEGLRTVPFFEQLIYLDSDGAIVDVYPQADSSPVQLSTEESSRAQITVSSGAPAEFLSGEQEVAVTFMTPVIASETGEPEGALLGRTSLTSNPILSPVTELLAGGIVGGGEGFIIDEQGRILLYPARPEQELTQYNFDDAVMLNVPGDGQSFRQREADGTRTLLYVLPVEGQSNWAVVMSVPNEVAVALAIQIALPTLLLLLVITSSGIALIMVTISSITEPLDALLGTVERIGRGQLDTPVEIEGEDEIGRLGRGFETMRQRLKRRLGEQERLLNVTRGVSSSLELFRTMPSILSSALEFTDAVGVRVVLDRGTDTPPEAYASGVGSAIMADLDETMLALVERQGVVVISQVWRASGVLDLSEMPAGIAALVAFPLRGENTYHGVFWLGYDEEHDFSESEMTYLSTLAGQTAVAVSNARLFNEAQERRRDLEAVLSSTADGIIVTDTNGRIALINPTAAQYFGVREDRVRGSRAADVVDVPMLADLLTDLQAPASEVEVPGRGGQTLLVKTSTIVSEGSIRGRVAVLRDISDLKELDNIKTVFLRMVSHDLRSPLTYMRGYISMLPLLGDLNQKQNESLEKIDVGISQISQMTERLTQLSRLRFGDTFKLEEDLINITELLLEIVDEQGAIAQDKGVALTTDISEDLPPMFADPMLLRQAVTNLLGNAIKYTPDGGTVSLQTRIQKANGARRLVEITVTDTGIGIRKEDQEELFNPFYRVPQREGDPPRPSGSGLGLALVKSIVEAHKGRVSMESEYGHGSTFTIIVPVEKKVEARG